MDILSRRKEIHDEQSFRQWGVVNKVLYLKNSKESNNRELMSIMQDGQIFRKCRQPSIDKRNEAYGLRHILLE